jgi:hypothetical protein
MNTPCVRLFTTFAAALLVISTATSIEAADKKPANVKKKLLVELYTSQG